MSVVMVLYVPAYFGKKMYRSDDQRLMALVGWGWGSCWKRLESMGRLLKILFSYSQSFRICMSINKINIK